MATYFKGILGAFIGKVGTVNGGERVAVSSAKYYERNGKSFNFLKDLWEEF